jgi:hypothetical protein
MAAEAMDFSSIDLNTIYHVPRQRPAPQLDSDKMGASVSSCPPLGQVTQLQSGTVAWVAVLEVTEDLAGEAWEVALWHTAREAPDTWTETLFSLVKETPSDLQRAVPSSRRLYFGAEVPVSTSLTFTLKFRQGSDRPWRWTRDELGMGDGTVIVNGHKTTESVAEDFGSIISDLDPSLQVKPAMSQAPGTRLWTIEGSVPAAKDEVSAFADIKLGLPWGSFLR